MSKPSGAPAKPVVPGGIPQSAKKIVQSVKEIVPSADEDQIYTELKACGMDPNEAVQRLVNQDPFVDVKRKKKTKEAQSPAPESRPRAPAGGTFRGGRGGNLSSGLDRQGSGRGNFAPRPGSGDSNGVRRPLPPRENGIHPKPLVPGGAGQQTPGQQKHTFTSVQGGAQAAPGPAAPPCMLSQAFGAAPPTLPGSGQSGLAANPGAPGGEPQRPLYSRGPMSGGWGSSGSTLADIVKGHQQQQQQQQTPQPTTTPPQQNQQQSQTQPPPQSAPSPSPQPPPTPPQYTPASTLTPAPSSPPSGVYSSASDPILNPSLDARAPGGGIKRELGTVGTQRPISKDRGLPYEPSLSGGARVSSPPSTSDLGGSLGDSSMSGGQSAPTASPIVPPPMPQERPLLQSDVTDGGEDGRAPVRNVGVTGQYGSRPAYQPQVVSKAPSSGLEWKPKAPGPTLPNSIGSSPVASEPMNRPTSPPQSAVASKLESLSIQQQQEEKPVILPGHLQVSEADRTRLSFGSFGAGFGGFGESTAPAKAATSGAQQHIPSSISATSQAYTQLPTSSIPPSSSVADSVTVPTSSSAHSEVPKHEGGGGLHQSQQYPQYPTYPGFSGVGLPHLSSQYTYDMESQGSDGGRLSSFSTPYGDPTSNFYSSSFRPQSESETKYSGLGSTAAASSKYGAAASTAGVSTASQEASASSSSGTSGQSSQAGLTGASPPGGAFAQQPLPPLHAAYAQSNLAPYQYPPHYYPMPPNYMYNPYSHSPYATPGNSGYPQGPAGGNYPPGAGGSYPPVGGVNTKYPSGPYKPGAAAGGAPGASAYGGYGAGPGGYGGAPAVSSGSATGYEDLSASQYKESNLYIPGQQALSREAAPTSSYYNIPGQSQHYAQQGHHGGYGGGLYHPSQSGPSQGGHQYPQQQQSQQPLSGGAGAGAGQSGGYQNQRGGTQQQSWNY